MTGTAELVLYVLAVDGPHTIDELGRRIGAARRDVEQAILDLRLAGNPVVTDQDGVRLARTADELAECAERLRVRAIHQLLTARALRATVRRMRARPAVQGRLWDVAS